MRYLLRKIVLLVTISATTLVLLLYSVANFQENQEFSEALVFGQLEENQNFNENSVICDNKTLYFVWEEFQENFRGSKMVFQENFVKNCQNVARVKVSEDLVKIVDFSRGNVEIELKLEKNDFLSRNRGQIVNLEDLRKNPREFKVKIFFSQINMSNSFFKQNHRF